MICPLLTIAAAPNKGGKKHCEGAECAWFVEKKGKCAVVANCVGQSDQSEPYPLGDSDEFEGGEYPPF